MSGIFFNIAAVVTFEIVYHQYRLTATLVFIDACCGVIYRRFRYLLSVQEYPFLLNTSKRNTDAESAYMQN